MIGSLKILKCSIMGYNSKTKVLSVNLPKNAFSGQAQFAPNLVQNHATLSRDSLSKDFFKYLWHDEALDKSSLSHFSKKISFLGNIGSFGSKLHNQLL